MRAVSVFFIFLSIAISCKSSNKLEIMLSDISSNSYFIPLTVSYKGISYQIVIPNSRLYAILKDQKGDDYTIDAHIDLLSQEIINKKEVELNNDSFDSIEPYILPKNWNAKAFDLSKLFEDGIQASEIDDQLILIKQLSKKGYLVYKDDETGLIVIRKPN